MQLRIAIPEDRPRVEALYESMGYRGRVHDSDRVLVADDGGDVVGVVRLCEEHGELVLRGMYIRPHYQRGGLGSEMLQRLTPRIGSRRCCCVPFTHLMGFYGKVGFRAADLEKAPGFLRDRIASYRRAGMEVTLMMRLGDATGTSHNGPE